MESNDSQRFSVGYCPVTDMVKRRAILDVRLGEM